MFTKELWQRSSAAAAKKTRNSSRMRYSERELYDDVVYVLYEMKKKRRKQ